MGPSWFVVRSDDGGMSGASGIGVRRNSTDRESLVPSFGAFPAFCHVCRQTTGEGQHLARLAGNVRAQIPGVGAREESSVRQREHLRSPRFLRWDRCLDPRAIALAKVIQQPSDPVSLKLSASRPVAESVRALRAVNEEEIPKARYCHSEMGANAPRPLLPQRLALRAADINAGQPASHRVEAGG